MFRCLTQRDSGRRGIFFLETLAGRKLLCLHAAKALQKPALTMEPETLFVAEFSSIIAEVHEQMEGNDDVDDDDLQAMAADALTSGVDEEYSFGLVLDERANAGSIEDRVFKATITNKRLKGLCIAPPANASCAEEMLCKALALVPNIDQICIGMAVTEAEAERILSAILRMYPTLGNLIIFLGSCGDGIANPLRKYLRQSTSLDFVQLHWGKFCSPHDTGNPLSLSEGSMKSICAGISESTSVEGISIEPPTTDDTSVVLAETLARTFSESSCLKEVFSNSHHRHFIDLIRSSLLQTEAVRKFDLCFLREEKAGRIKLFLGRNTPWKPILSKNVPLALWPLILGRTKDLAPDNSHRIEDVLYFLIKEKNDVLFQNVRRRRIRKRKRFQL